MAKLGIELWSKIQTPQGRAFISDSVEFMSDEEVIELAKNALAWEESAVKVLREFLETHLTKRAADGNKIRLDGTFRCPECNFSEKHLASCSRR